VSIALYRGRLPSAEGHCTRFEAATFFFCCGIHHAALQITGEIYRMTVSEQLILNKNSRRIILLKQRDLDASLTETEIF